MSNLMNYLVRPVVAGLISTLLAALGVILSFQVDSILLSGIYLPILFVDPHSYVARMIAILVFWFLVGVIIAYLTRKNLRAVGIWLLLYIIFFVIAFLRIFTV